MSNSKHLLEVKLGMHGIKHPVFTVEMAEKTGLPLEYACASLMMETSGGFNEFGHDPGGAVVGGWVSKHTYETYVQRLEAGVGHVQGVGPCQLTDRGLQQEADKLGGCWSVPCNLEVGFGFLKGLIDEHGPEGGFAAYNGSGPAAEAYGQRAMAYAEEFKKVIA